MIAASMIASLALLLAPVAQDPEKQEPAELQAAGQPVEVEGTTADSSIRRRLRSILATTERFGDVTLEVENGVVIFDGRVKEKSQREWVADLARNTAGVAAVLNRIELVEPPLWDLAPAVAEVRSLWRGFVSLLPRIAAGLVVFVVIALLSRWLTRVLGGLLSRRLESELLRTALQKVVMLLIWLGAIYLFLRITGLTRIAATVVGGTGLIGIVLGFAFRDIAENFLASVLISLQRPFRYGDTIEVEGHRGVVQRVTPRGTILLDFDGNYIQIANAQVYKSTIKNFTANPNVRQQFSVGVGYDAGVARAQDVIMAVLRDHPAVLGEPKPMVLVDQLASATVNLNVYFWIDGTEHSPLKVRSALMRIVLSALQQAGVSMPDDAREVVFPELVPVRMVEPGAEPPARREARDEPEPSAADTADATHAEGDLASETEEINDQGRRSRSPEEGADILAK